MTETNRAQLWQELHQILTRLLDLERCNVGAVQASAIEEFIGHNEFGLALDQLIYALGDSEISPSEATTRLLSEASRLMRTSG